MKFGLFALATPLFDTEGGGPGAPPAPSPAPGGNVSAPAPSAPPPTAPPAAPAPPSFSYKEDRSNWVPSHVVRQATEQRAKIEAQLQYERERVAALSGVKMPTAPDPDADAIRSQFAKYYPGLSKMEAMQEKIEKLLGYDFEGIQKSQEQAWQVAGNQALATFENKVKAVYGGADLAPKALQRITTAFAHEVQNDPETRERYNSGDMSIMDDFIKEYTSGILDPYRRSTAAAAAPRPNFAARLPRGGGSSAIVGARPAALKPSDPGFHEAAFKRFTGEQ